VCVCVCVSGLEGKKGRMNFSSFSSLLLLLFPLSRFSQENKERGGGLDDLFEVKNVGGELVKLLLSGVLGLLGFWRETGGMRKSVMGGRRRGAYQPPLA